MEKISKKRFLAVFGLYFFTLSCQPSLALEIKENKNFKDKKPTEFSTESISNNLKIDQFLKIDHFFQMIAENIEESNEKENDFNNQVEITSNTQIKRVALSVFS